MRVLALLAFALVAGCVGGSKCHAADSCCGGRNCVPPPVSAAATSTYAQATVTYQWGPVYRTTWRGVVVFCGYGWVPSQAAVAPPAK